MKTLGLASSFRGAEFTNLSSREKTIAEKVLNTAPIVHTAYRPRFHVDYIQDTMASITIVGLKRSDRGRYRFDVKTLREDINEFNTLSSIMELTVHCKQTNKSCVWSCKMWPISLKLRCFFTQYNAYHN